MTFSPALSVFLVLSFMVLSSSLSVAEPSQKTALGSSPGGEASTHRVRRGETLGSLAERYGTSVQVLVRLNGIRNPNRIHAGRLLQLPASPRLPVRPSHTHRPGGMEKAWPEELALIADLYRHARFDEARTMAASVEMSRNASAEARAYLAFLQGAIEVAFGDFEVANGYFEGVYRDHPGFEAGDSISPKVRALLAGPRAGHAMRR